MKNSLVTIGLILMATMISAAQHDKIIHVSAELSCSIDSAYAYFTENTLLERWLAVKADVEMKVGGKYELFWSPEDPDLTNNSTYGCKVLSMDKPYYFSIEWKGNKDHKAFMNNVRPLTNVTVVFNKINANKTRVTLLHTGWQTDKDWDSAYQFFEKAWAGAFSKLEMQVNKTNIENRTEGKDLFCYYLKLTKKYADPSNWTSKDEQIIADHARWLDVLGTQGVLLFAGRTLFEPGHKDLFGIAIIKAKDIEHARRLMASDPAVIAGIQQAEIFPYSMGIKHFDNLKD